MTNGYNASTKSRSCENNLDTCGRKVSDELAISSSSLIDLPTPSVPSHADYDNLPLTNGHDTTNGGEIPPIPLIQQQTISRPTGQSSSPLLGELDQKTKDAIDARLRDIDDDADYPRKSSCWAQIDFDRCTF